MKNDYCVYMHTAPNNKKYIGITCQKPENRWNYGLGYKQHLYFYRAIKKYGWDNFKHKILFTNLTKEEAERKEIELIVKHKSNNTRYGYNIANGGFHSGKTSEKTKQKIRDTLKGHIGYMAGKNMTKEAKEKIREANLGKKLTQETKEKIREAHLGKLLTKEHKENISKSHIGLNCKKVLCVETGIIYNSITEASIQMKKEHSNIISCCKGRRNKAGGYHWKYVLEGEN